MIELYPFQEEALVKAWKNKNLQVVYDCGTGKSFIAVELVRRLLESGEVDHAMVVCERSKIVEWVKDFEEHTPHSTQRHHGPTRMKKIASGLPDVLVSSYETIRQDVATFLTPRKVRPGKLNSYLSGKRWIIIYDEMARLSNRSSKLYKAHWLMLKELREENPVRVVGLTATPIEKDWEDEFNQLRIMDPDSMPLVKDFESRYVRFRDIYNRPRYAHSRMKEFSDLAQNLIIRKRKTDPDIMEQFPQVVEEVNHVEMSPEHKRFYKLCEDIVHTGELPGGTMFLRQVAGHPASLIYSQGSELAQMVLDELGESYLRRIPCTKEQALTEHLRAVQSQGDKAVVFTFFGQSILKVLRSTLEDEGHKVFDYHGGLTASQADEQLEAFKAHQGPAVFLSSDSGSKGINLPEASYVIEYESALTYANRTQRINRIHRLTSDTPSVHCLTLVTKDTVEEHLVDNMLDRNQFHDELLNEADAEGDHMLSTDRKELFRS